MRKTEALDVIIQNLEACKQLLDYIDVKAQQEWQQECKEDLKTLLNNSVGFLRALKNIEYEEVQGDMGIGASND